MITQAELKSQLHYDAESGIFTRIVSNSNKVQVGDIAGFPDKNGYIIIAVFGKQYRAHRLAWLYVTGHWPKDQIDHVNGISGDNRLVNIRDCTQYENILNQGLKKSNNSGYKGVSYFKRDGTWMAMGRAFGERYFLGYHITPQLASKSYQEFAKEYHGEFFKEA